MSNKSRELTRKGSLTVRSKLTKPVIFPVLMLLGGTLLLSGCSSIGKDEYSCPGIPSGVQCMSARDVYAATNDGNIPHQMQAGEQEHVHVDSDTSYVSENSSDLGGRVVDNYVAPRLPNRPVPIRTPAQVMRIWVAPWEDTNGDLIVTGYIYTEIEPRKWVIGEGIEQNIPMLKPLQSINSTSKTETK